MKTSLFANPATTIEIMAGFVATTTIMAIVILFNSVAGDDWLLDNLNSVIAALLSLLIVNRIALGIENRLALATWIAAFVVTAILSVTQWFDGSIEKLQEALHIEDLDDLCMWLVTPIGLLVANRFDRIGHFPLRVLIAGFVAQSLSTGLDLMDGWLTYSVGYDSDLMEVLVDFSEFVFLQFYLVGLTLFVASLYIGRRPAAIGPAVGMLGHAAQFLRADLRASAWRLRNPGRSYGAFYAERIAGKLDRGMAHSTLGTKDRVKTDADPMAHRQTALAPRERGIGTFKFLRRLGLEPWHRCVDYGCGSLRIGMHLIDYLDRGNYWGVDVTDRFYTDGLTLLDPEARAVKMPRFSVISDELLAEVRNWRPDVVVSVSVLMHVPPSELKSYLARIIDLLDDDAKAIILFDRTEKNTRLASMSWGYSDAFLLQQTRKIDRELTVSFRYCEPVRDTGRHIVARHAMILSRD